MRSLKRRDFLGLLAVVAGLSLAIDAEASPIIPTEDNKICEREAKANIEEIINRMLDAAEKTSGKKYTGKERENITDRLWLKNRNIIAEHYAFHD